MSEGSVAAGLQPDSGLRRGLLSALHCLIRFGDGTAAAVRGNAFGGELPKGNGTFGPGGKKRLGGFVQLRGAAHLVVFPAALPMPVALGVPVALRVIAAQPKFVSVEQKRA
jgi:hypothetical protein